MNGTFVVYSSVGPARDRSKGTREQAWWDDHAAFIDNLVAEGFLRIGGPLPDEDGAIIVVAAETEADVRERLRDDPWYQHEILTLETIKRWEIFIDER
jgi:uncharacterized protein YciI